jgi:probable HAF family extracellular repeat protein
MTLLHPARAATFAWAVSADGAVVVGAREFDGQREAFRWERRVLTGLGALRSGDFLHSEAYTVNSDGSVVVGDAETATGGIEAFRWTRAEGMRSVRQLLEAAGVRLGGWYLMKATLHSSSDVMSLPCGWPA